MAVLTLILTMGGAFALGVCGVALGMASQAASPRKQSEFYFIVAHVLTALSLGIAFAAGLAFAAGGAA